MRRSRVLAAVVTLIMLIWLLSGVVVWLPDQPEMPQWVDPFF